MDISKAKLSRYSLLRHKKYREKEGLFIVQGKKAVEDTVGKFETEAILCLDMGKNSVPEGASNIYLIPETVMKKVSTLEKIPEIAAIYKIPKTAIDLKAHPTAFTLVLDGVQDPGNLGTIIRTAHWFGIKNIFCSHDTVDIYNPKVVMATMGSIAAVKTVYCSLKELFENNQEIPVYGLLLEGDDIFKCGNIPPGFIVMGSEGHGPSAETVKYITRGLTIPPANPQDSPDSLNVAIATAITLGQLIR